MKRWKKSDVLLALAVLALAGLLFLLPGRREGGQWVVISVDGEEQQRIPLSQDGSYVLNGGSNILQIQAGQIWISQADCPDQYCCRQGSIAYSSQSIVCLPNRLIVRVEGAEGGIPLVS